MSIAYPTLNERELKTDNSGLVGIDVLCLFYGLCGSNRVLGTAITFDFL